MPLLKASLRRLQTHFPMDGSNSNQNIQTLSSNNSIQLPFRWYRVRTVWCTHNTVQLLNNSWRKRTRFYSLWLFLSTLSDTLCFCVYKQAQIFFLYLNFQTVETKSVDIEFQCWSCFSKDFTSIKSVLVNGFFFISVHGKNVTNKKKSSI